MAFQPLIRPVGLVRFFLLSIAVRYNTLSAASSVGKWPLRSAALRNLAFKLSIALVSGMTSLTPLARCRVGFYDLVVGFGASERNSQGRPLYTLTCEVALVLGRPSD